MKLDADLAPDSPVRQALRRFRDDATTRAPDRRTLWQERLRRYVSAELEDDSDTHDRVRGESARAHLREG